MIKNIIFKVDKKAFNEIKKISLSQNMVQIESYLNDAVLKTFGMYNLGLLKIRMNNREAFEELKKRRIMNFQRLNKEAKKYIVSYIPESLKKTIMYNNLIKKIYEE